MSETLGNTKGILQRLITGLGFGPQQEENKETQETKSIKEIEKTAFTLSAYKMSSTQAKTFKTLLEVAQKSGNFKCDERSGLTEGCLPLIIDEINNKPGIIRINLTNMTLTDKGACYLATYLSDRVTTVCLSGNKIKDLGFRALFLKRSIKELNISDNAITDKSIELLSKDSDNTIKSLDISGCKSLTPRCGQYLADCQNLKTLAMYSGFDTNYENQIFILNLSPSRSLTHLEFQHTSLNSQTVFSLCEMHNLSLLNLTHCFDAIEDSLADVRPLVTLNTYFPTSVWDPLTERKLLDTTERRILEHKKGLLPVQQGNMQMLLATHYRAGQGSPILHTFTKNVIYDKNLWREIFAFIDMAPKPLCCILKI